MKPKLSGGKNNIRFETPMAIVLALFVAAAIMLQQEHAMLEASIKKNIPLLDNVMMAGRYTCKGNLMIERSLAGDASIDAESIFALFTQAEMVVEDCISGRSNIFRIAAIAPENPEMLAQLKEIKNLIERFSEIARQRLKDKNAGIQKDIIEYRSAFFDFEQKLSSIEYLVNESIGRLIAREEKQHAAIFALFTLLGAAAFSWIFIYSKRRREAEENLLRERSVLNGIMKSTDVMLVYLDLNFNFVAVNTAYEEGCKKSREELLGRNHFELFPNAENEEIFRRVRDAGESVFYKDKPFEYPDQPERGVTYWDWSLTPVKDDDETIGLVYSLRETTKYKLAEKALANSEKKYRNLIESLQEGIWMIDKEGITTFVNASMARMLGYSAEEMLGKHVFSFMDERGKKIAEEKIELRKKGKKEQQDFEFIHKDGRRIYTAIAISAVFDEAGNYAGALAGIMDISDRKRAEEEVVRSLKEKEVLLREIHHRVKNNMQVICSLLNLQAVPVEDENIRSMFEESRNRVAAMAKVHEQLYRSPDLAHIDFKEYLQSLASGISNAYQKPNINLLVGVDSISLDINTAVPCGLIVNELVSNCFKHAFPGTKKGTIKLEIANKPDKKMLLAVEDDGVGFPAGLDFENPKTFGLKMVNILARQIRGTIKVLKPKGTRFEIIFTPIEKMGPDY